MNSKQNLKHFIYLLLFALPAPALPGMTNEDIMTLVRNNVSEEVIIKVIEKDEKPGFDTSLDTIVDLKEAGVSEAIIRAMMLRAPEEPPPPPPPEFEPEPFFDPIVGNEYYTRYCFYYEKGRWLATNYTRGTFVPINTRVTLLRKRKDSFVLQVGDTREKIKMQNVRDFTMRDADEIVSKLLSHEPTPLAGFGSDVAEDIQSGILKKGMTKKQVIMARGYPPGHRTPRLEGSKWIYWSSRFVTLTLVFDGEILLDGRGLQ